MKPVFVALLLLISAGLWAAEPQIEARLHTLRQLSDAERVEGHAGTGARDPRIARDIQEKGSAGRATRQPGHRRRSRSGNFAGRCHHIGDGAAGTAGPVGVQHFGAIGSLRTRQGLAVRSALRRCHEEFGSGRSKPAARRFHADRPERNEVEFTRAGRQSGAREFLGHLVSAVPQGAARSGGSLPALRFARLCDPCYLR